MLSKKIKRVISLMARQNRVYCNGDNLAMRAASVRNIYERAQDGYVYLVCGGRDCDGVQYEGLKTLVKAIPRAIEKRMDDALEWADGPMHFTVLSPDDGEEVRYSSRDLALEAFEDGHAHVLYA